MMYNGTASRRKPWARMPHFRKEEGVEFVFDELRQVGAGNVFGLGEESRWTMPKSMRPWPTCSPSGWRRSSLAWARATVSYETPVIQKHTRQLATCACG